MILPCCYLDQGAIFICAQAGCSNCLGYLLEQNEGLVHACIRYAEIGGIPYADAAQEGRIGLWRAILHYDPARPVAFSTFAWRHIWGRMWRYTLRFGQTGEALEEGSFESSSQLAEEAWREAQIAEAVREALELLPERLRGILEQVYGLSGQPPMSLAAIGRQMGLTRESIRRLRNEALLLLRLPAFSSRLRELCLRDSRQAYRQARQVSDTWLRSQRRRK